jgi:hypothetical protein
MELNLPKKNTEYGAVGGGCFGSKSHIEVHMELERSVYKQGQSIRPEVEITLEPGKVWTSLSKHLMLEGFMLSEKKASNAMKCVVWAHQESALICLSCCGIAGMVVWSR